MKFGYLKKAAVLHQYGRFKEAFLTIADGAILVKAEMAKLRDIEEKNKQKWKTKLGIPLRFDLPVSKEEILQEKKIDLEFVKRMDIGEIDPAKVLTFIHQTILIESQKFDKNQYLNSQIEYFYVHVDNELRKKYQDIKNVKKRIEELEELLDLQEGGQVPQGVKIGYFGKKPTKLDLVPLETYIKNLQDMVVSEMKKLKASEPLEPWHPVKSGMIQDTDMMLMASKK